MRIFWEMYVNDMLVSKRFYVHILGLSLKREQHDFAVVGTDDMELHICPLADLPVALLNGRGQPMGGRVEFVFEVDDVEECYRRIVASDYPVHEELTDQMWGKTDFRIMDPDGAYLRITSPQRSENLCLVPSN
jgi:lactoylglutathione lyase